LDRFASSPFALSQRHITAPHLVAALHKHPTPTKMMTIDMMKPWMGFGFPWTRKQKGGPWLVQRGG